MVQRTPGGPSVPSTGASYDGIGSANYSVTGVLPDPNAAVGSTQIVETVNTAYAVYSKSGATWSTAQTVAGPMPLSQIASTTQGSMVGDYLSTSVVNGRAVAVFAVGKAPANGQAFDEGMYAVVGGLTLRAGITPASPGPVLYTAPDRERTLPAAVRR
ncbi:hypothetical protein AB0A71_20625 [Kitasatospora aureofaciens]|uniref:hypothetical protein n=1 Tax=Kitasatospora aureofaciens TaxID=1894 RepID=UPI0033F72FE5